MKSNNSIVREVLTSGTRSLDQEAKKEEIAEESAGYAQPPQHELVSVRGDGLDHTLSDNCLLFRASDEAEHASDPEHTWKVWKAKHDQEEERRFGVRQRAMYGSNMAVLGWIGLVIGLTWLAMIMLSRPHLP